MKIIYVLIGMMMASMAVASKAVLLLSLGLPNLALQSYLIQGKYYQVPLVIRGLYTERPNTMGSLGETAKRLHEIMGKQNIGGILINPLLFRAFNIKAVPALVIYDDNLSCIKSTEHGDRPCPSNSYDVIYGNLPIPKQLHLMANQSTSRARARTATTLLMATQKRGL